MNNKVLLKLFDIDDGFVEDTYVETNNDINTVYLKLNKMIEFCPNCGSIRLLSKGFYKSKVVGCPFNGKPTYIVCKIRKYKCKDCHAFPVDPNPIPIRIPI